MTDNKTPKPAKVNTKGTAPIKITADAAGTWLQIGEKETGVVYFGPFSESDPRVINLRDKVLCR